MVFILVWLGGEVLPRSELMGGVLGSRPRCLMSHVSSDELTYRATGEIMVEATERFKTVMVEEKTTE